MARAPRSALGLCLALCLSAGGEDPIVLGSGEHTYEWVRGWPKLRPAETLGTTHGGIAIDSRGRIYVNTDTERAVMVFEPDGTLVGSWGKELGAGVHGMTLWRRGDEEVLFLAYLRNEVIQTTLDGQVLWRVGTPVEAGVYDTTKKLVRYHPTSVAVAPNGHFYVSDGYGMKIVHHYDADHAYVGSFGRLGTEPGEFRGPHGILCDTRGAEPRLVVADRDNHRLQTFDLDGKPLAVYAGVVHRPCAMAQRGKDLVVPDLDGRVTILDERFELVVHLGENDREAERGNFELPPEAWRDGVFFAPHFATWDAEGNLYVVEWSKYGRLVKLRRIHG